MLYGGKYTRMAAGDGWFGDLLGGIAKTAIGGAVGLVTGGPAGAFLGASRTVASLLGGKAGPATTSGATQGRLPIQTAPIAPRPVPTLTPARFTGVATPPLVPSPTVLPGGAVIGGSGIGAAGQVQLGPLSGSGAIGLGTGFAGYAGGAQPGAPTGTQLMCSANGAVRARATHANKSGYFLKSGQYVAPGTKCVVNRRLNPLNPRALSRSMRRLSSARKAVKGIIRFESVARGGKLNMGKRPGAKRCR